MIIAIALGSNIHPERNLRAAAAMLRDAFPGIRFSRVYRSAPREIEDQDDFLNAVAVLQSERTPESVFSILQSIERALKKAPPYRYGPRTIDLDLLLAGDTIHPDRTQWNDAYRRSAIGDQLVVPHPRMHERRFVLEPLCECLDPDTVHPVLGETWSNLLRKTLDQSCAPSTLVL